MNYKIELDLTDGENTVSDAYIIWYSKTHWRFMGNLIKVKSLCVNWE